MKKYKNIVRVAALSLLMPLVSTSCHDLLDVSPEGQVTLDDIFTSDYNTGAYLSSCYEYLPPYGWAYNWRTCLPVAYSDEAHEYSTNASYITTNVYGTITADFWNNDLISDNCSANWGNRNWYTYRPVTSWSVYYQDIKRCNTFLANIDTAVVPDEIDREGWKAEIRTLRAFMYHHLVKDFGDVPLITEPLEPDDVGADLVRTPAAEVLDFVIEECKAALAVESDDFGWFITTSENDQRMYKATAAILLSRAALYKASPLFCGGEDYWDEAAELTEEALQACLDGGMQLWTSVNSSTTYSIDKLIGSHNPTEEYDALAPAYYEYLTSTRSYGTSPTDKESIRCSSLNMGTNQNTTQMGIPQHGANKAGLCPTQETVDAFPMRDGSYILDLEQPYKDEAHLEPNYAPGVLVSQGGLYDPENPYANRDPRFYANILFNGAYAINSSQTEITVQTYNGGADGILPGELKYTCTGYYSRRHMRPDLYPGSWVVVKCRTMRLAELYLNAAEAMAKSGDWTGGLEYANVIRDRATMPHIVADDQADAVLKIAHERRIEFCFDEMRYMDLRRSATSESNQNLYDVHLTGMWIERTSDGGTADDFSDDTFSYTRIPLGQAYDKATGTFTGSEWVRDMYKPKYRLFPIELDEATRLSQATGLGYDYWQNPGW